MNSNYKRWQKLFLACLGLAVGTAFCMKWMEGDLWQNGEKFTVLGLEFSYGSEKMRSILGGLDPITKKILSYHLHFDFAFMAGIFPGIAALCMMAREKCGSNLIRKLLFVFAALQTIAWGCDIYENLQLLSWLKDPVIGSEFGIYKIIVWVKWIIAVGGVLISLGYVFRKRIRFAELRG